jgi:hypothetical protein
MDFIIFSWIFVTKNRISVEFRTISLDVINVLQDFIRIRLISIECHSNSWNFIRILPAEPQNRRSAETQNPRTGEPQNRRTPGFWVSNPDTGFLGSERRTAELQNRRTAEPQNRRTAEPQASGFQTQTLGFWVATLGFQTQDPYSSILRTLTLKHRIFTGWRHPF